MTRPNAFKTTSLIATAVLAAAACHAPSALAAGGHGGGAFVRTGSYGGHYGGYRGGYYGNRYGGYRGGYWGYRGWGPGYFWGGLGVGLGVGALVYNNGWPTTYYAPYDAGFVSYDAPAVVVPVRPGRVIVETPAEGRVVRSGQPVPAMAQAPEPIFYPRNGQDAAALENDRRECNRWATTQPGAMADASIFQRATFACMDGRGYTVR